MRVRVKIIKDTKDFKAGSTAYLKKRKALSLISKGIAIISKDMEALDVSTK